MHCYSLRFRKSPHFKNYGSFNLPLLLCSCLTLFWFILVSVDTRELEASIFWRWQMSFQPSNVIFTFLIITVWEYRDQSVKNWNLNQVHSWTDRPIRRESKTVCLPGSGFNAVDYGFQVLDSSLHQWNLESGIQLVGFRISWTVFRIPKPRSLHSMSEFLLNSSFHKQTSLGLAYMERELIVVCENIRFSSLLAVGDVKRPQLNRLNWYEIESYEYINC